MTKATGVYDLPDPDGFVAVKRYEADYTIMDFLISPSKDSMVAVDREKTLYIWNLITNEMVFKQQLQEDWFLNSVMLIGGDDRGFYVSTDSGTSLMDWHTGEVIWHNDAPGYYSTLNLSKDHSFLTKFGFTNNFFVIDQNGNTVSYEKVLDLEDYSLVGVLLGSDGKKAISVLLGEGKHLVALSDGQSADTVQIDDLGTVDYIDFDVDGNVLVCEMANDISHISGMSLDQSNRIYKMVENIYKIDSLSGGIIWKTSIEFTQEGSYRSFNIMDSPAGISGVHKRMICNTGNVQTIINLENGKIEHQTEWPAAIINVLSYDDSSTASLLKNGDLAINTFNDFWESGDDSAAAVNSFAKDLEKALVIEEDDGTVASVMALPEGKPYIILYETNIIPPDYNEITSLQFSIMNSASAAGDIAAADYLDLTSGHHLSAYDLKTNRMLKDYLVEDIDDPVWIQSSDGRTLYLAGRKNTGLIMRELPLNIEKSKTDFDVISPDAMAMEIWFEMDRNYIHYVYLQNEKRNDDNSAPIIQSDPDMILIAGTYDMTSKKKSHEDSVCFDDWDRSWTLNSVVFSPDGSYMLADIKRENVNGVYYSLFLINADGSSKPVLIDTSDKQFCRGTFNQSCSEFAIADQANISVYGLDGGKIAEMPYKNDSFMSLAYLDNELYLLTNDEIIYRYSRKYQLLEKYIVDIGDNPLYSPMDPYIWEKADDTLYLKYINCLNIVELGQSCARATVQNVLGYSAKMKTVLLSYDTNGLDTYLVRLPIYSVEELVKAGQMMIDE